MEYSPKDCCKCLVVLFLYLLLVPSRTVLCPAVTGIPMKPFFIASSIHYWSLVYLLEPFEPEVLFGLLAHCAENAFPGCSPILLVHTGSLTLVLRLSCGLGITYPEAWFIPLFLLFLTSATEGSIYLAGRPGLSFYFSCLRCWWWSLTSWNVRRRDDWPMFHDVSQGPGAHGSVFGIAVTVVYRVHLAIIFSSPFPVPLVLSVVLDKRPCSLWPV